MSDDLSKKLLAVREIANAELKHRHGADVHPHESILVAQSKYIGHRFKSRGIMIQWVIETDTFHVIDGETKETLDSFHFSDASQRYHQERRAA